MSGTSAAELVEGVLAGNRAALGRAITLIESRALEHQKEAEQLLAELLPRTGGAHRIGITGVPGVGKSTFIEALGTSLTARGKRVAVLAVDPSSQRTGGSILGDKTRMAKLANDPRAFVRPSPTSGTLGGVARRTRESMLISEAAGFDVILVETVGSGQSETQVFEMVDFFLVLMLPGAGDELQGIKKGVLELADMIAVNKADGEQVANARRAAADLRAALHILAAGDESWRAPVVMVSALEGTGLEEVWKKMLEHRELSERSGDFEARRQQQQLDWMHALIADGLRDALEGDPAVGQLLESLEEEVVHRRVPATRAARKVLSQFLGVTPEEASGKKSP